MFIPSPIDSLSAMSIEQPRPLPQAEKHIVNILMNCANRVDPGANLVEFRIDETAAALAREREQYAREKAVACMTHLIALRHDDEYGDDRELQQEVIAKNFPESSPTLE